MYKEPDHNKSIKYLCKTVFNNLVLMTFDFYCVRFLQHYNLHGFTRYLIIFLFFKFAVPPVQNWWSQWPSSFYAEDIWRSGFSQKESTWKTVVATEIEGSGVGPTPGRKRKEFCKGKNKIQNFIHFQTVMNFMLRRE